MKKLDNTRDIRFALPAPGRDKKIFFFQSLYYICNTVSRGANCANSIIQRIILKRSSGHLGAFLLSLFLLSSCLSPEERYSIESRIQNIRSELATENANLEAAQDEMQRIKEFQFGRTQDERTEEIRQQSQYINDLQNHIYSLERDLAENEALLQ